MFTHSFTLALALSLFHSFTLSLVTSKNVRAYPEAKCDTHCPCSYYYVTSIEHIFSRPYHKVYFSSVTRAMFEKRVLCESKIPGGMPVTLSASIARDRDNVCNAVNNHAISNFGTVPFMENLYCVRTHGHAIVLLCFFDLSICFSC